MYILNFSTFRTIFIHIFKNLSLETLYNQYKNLVYNLALQYVQNIEDAEEITQDVFVSVYQNMSNFKEESSISTWIYKITINKSLDFIKAKNRKKRFAFMTSIFFNNSNDLKHDTQHFNHPGIALEQKEALSILFKHINDLPNNQKTAIILMKIENKTQKETAEIMNMSTKAVESLIQRAKVNLLKKINKNEGK